jgi:hypothetical protein
METEPVNLYEALASFDDIYSPRIIARMNDYDVRIAHARGDHVWHLHDLDAQHHPGPTRRGPARARGWPLERRRARSPSSQARRSR